MHGQASAAPSVPGEELVATGSGLGNLPHHAALHLVSSRSHRAPFSLPEPGEEDVWLVCGFIDEKAGLWEFEIHWESKSSCQTPMCLPPRPLPLPSGTEVKEVLTQERMES